MIIVKLFQILFYCFTGYLNKYILENKRTRLVLLNKKYDALRK